MSVNIGNFSDTTQHLIKTYPDSILNTFILHSSPQSPTRKNGNPGMNFGVLVNPTVSNDDRQDGDRISDLVMLMDLQSSFANITNTDLEGRSKGQVKGS